MTRRDPLKKTIIKSWKWCIDNHYVEQRINSERSLQASFWMQLDNRLPSTRRMFIEPGLSIKTSSGLKKVHPDIAICNTREVIAIIELKYQPREQPKYKKDIATLDLLSKHRGDLKLRNKRFRGAETDDGEYPFSSSMLFVWAGIHGKLKQEQEDIYCKGMKYLEQGYVELHAETDYDEAPMIYEKKP